MKLLNNLTLLAVTLRQKSHTPLPTKEINKKISTVNDRIFPAFLFSWVMKKSTKCTWRLERQISEGALSIRQLSALLQKVLVILKD
jgi:hypothetical protein